MNETEQQSAIEAIKQAKARYFRGVDTADGDLVRSVLAEDCELDYNGCLVDPATGKDFMPQMNVVLRGRDSWVSDAFVKAGIVSIHQGYNFDIEFVSDSEARVILAMTDRLFMPEGAPCSLITGYGYYHETYEKRDGTWQIKALRIRRLRVEAQ